MKFRLKLLKEWTDAAGKSYKPGTVIETEEKELAQSLVFDGTAEKSEASHNEPDIAAIVKSAVADAVKNLPVAESKAKPSISVKDLSDDDPTHGYGPRVNGRKMTRDERIVGLADFAKEVYQAAAGNVIPERLRKSQERSQNVIEKGKNYIEKAAGTGAVAGQDTYGGFLIPSEFSTMLIEASASVATVRPRATAVQLGTNSMELPQFKDYTHTSKQVYGGVIAYWAAENAQLTATRPQVESINLRLHKLTALAHASHEMMRFSPVTVGSFLLPAMSEAVAFAEDDAFIAGDGVGKPLGVINAPCTTSIAIEAGQTLAASAFVTKNALNMYQALKVARSGAVAWVHNKADLFRWLALCTIDVGTGGAPAGLIQRLPGTPDMNMLGFPLVDSEHCKAAGTVGDIVLGDWSTYLIADDRNGPEVASSMHLYFDYGQESFRVIKYVGGQPRYSSTFSRQNSTNTTAAFVTLAARS